MRPRAHPTDSAPPTRDDSSRACKSASLPRPYAQANPAHCEYPCRPPTNASQNCASMYAASPACSALSFAPLHAPPTGTRLPADDADAQLRRVDPTKFAAKEKTRTILRKRPRPDTSVPAPPAATPPPVPPHDPPRTSRATEPGRPATAPPAPPSAPSPGLYLPFRLSRSPATGPG